jgi:hypothetical protein
MTISLDRVRSLHSLEILHNWAGVAGVLIYREALIRMKTRSIKRSNQKARDISH